MRSNRGLTGDAVAAVRITTSHWLFRSLKTRTKRVAAIARISGRVGRFRVPILIIERKLNILLPFCYPIRWQRTTQADIGWSGVAKIPKENRMLHNWPLRAEMAVAALRVRCMSIRRLERKRSRVWPTANQLRITKAIESANFEI